MLRVQRGSLNIIARKLQESALIRYKARPYPRPRLDAVHLEEAAASSYATVNRHFERLVGGGLRTG